MASSVRGSREPQARDQPPVTPMHLAPDIRQAKATLRRQVISRLKSMSAGKRTEGSAKALELLASQPVWKAAGSVLLYAPMEGELDIWPMAALGLAAGKALA